MSNYCEKIISNGVNKNLRFRVKLEKVTDEYFLKVYKHFNLKRDLYKLIEIKPYDPGSYEQNHFNIKLYLIIDFIDEETNEIINICNQLDYSTIFGIAHNYYIHQIEDDVNINIVPTYILWKYYAKLYSIRFIIKYYVEFLDQVLDMLLFTKEVFDIAAKEKLNLVCFDNNPKNNYYLEDNETVRMRDEYIINCMVHDFVFLKKDPDFRNYLKERQNII